jgi:hypothetical protein
MVKDSCQQAFEQLLKTCAIEIPVKGVKGVKKAKRKRTGQMSGYNCFTKTLYAAEKERAKKENKTPMSYSELLKMKTWSTLEAKQKVHWKGLADMGCPENA